MFHIVAWYMVYSIQHVWYTCGHYIEFWQKQVVSIVDAKVWQQSQRMVGMVVQHWAAAAAAVLRPRLTRWPGPDSSAEARSNPPPLLSRLSPTTSLIRRAQPRVSLLPHHVWQVRCQVASEYYKRWWGPNPPKHLPTPPLVPAPSASPLHGSWMAPRLTL